MTALREEYPQVSVEVLCGLFGRKRQWYYKKASVVVSEAQRTKLIEEHIAYYRGLMPRIGGAKLYGLVREDVGKEVTRGRDSFLKAYSSMGFKLGRPKRIHTTNSNHVYRKYPNLISGIDARNVNHIWVSFYAKILKTIENIATHRENFVLYFDFNINCTCLILRIPFYSICSLCLSTSIAICCSSR